MGANHLFEEGSFLFSLFAFLLIACHGRT